MHWSVFELDGTSPSGRWPLVESVARVAEVRDGLASALLTRFPDLAPEVERLLVGRGARENDKDVRVRIVPLPGDQSDGNPLVGWIAIGTPSGCPLAGPVRVLVEAGENEGFPLSGGAVVSDPSSVIRRFGLGPGCGAGGVWVSQTPAILRGVRPGKDIRGAVAQALRHAGQSAPLVSARVWDGPFGGEGPAPQHFLRGTRFSEQAAWYVGVAFASAPDGPVLLGDGRYCGLGLFRPLSWQEQGLRRFPVTVRGRQPVPRQRRYALAEAVRRALMSLDASRNGAVATLFSGHEGTDRGPARSGAHRHIYCLLTDDDGDHFLDHLTIIAPWMVDRTWTPTLEDLHRFDRGVSALSTVVAGEDGVLALATGAGEASRAALSSLLGPSREWQSLTSYVPTRHSKGDCVEDTTQDLVNECLRRGLPSPEAVVLRVGGGGKARATLRFRDPVSGPILLGRTAHQGGGAFCVVP